MSWPKWSLLVRFTVQMWRTWNWYFCICEFVSRGHESVALEYFSKNIVSSDIFEMHFSFLACRANNYLQLGKITKKKNGKKTTVTTRKSTLNGHNFVPTYVAGSEGTGVGHIFRALRHAVFLHIFHSQAPLPHRHNWHISVSENFAHKIYLSYRDANLFRLLFCIFHKLTNK